MSNFKTNLYRLFSVCIILLLSNFYSNSAWGQCNPAASDPNFNPNDTGFGFGQGNVSGINKFVVMDDNKIIVIGSADTYNNQPVDNLYRLNEDGTLDNSFTLFSATPYTNASLSDIELLPNQQLLVSGNLFDATNQGKYIIRINPDGSVDNSFSVTGLEATSNVRNLVVQPDGKIIVIGFLQVAGLDKDIIRLNTDGSIDTSFIMGHADDTLSHYNYGTLTSATLQNDGKIIIIGDFNQYNTINKKNIVRLNTDGTIDNSFLTLVTGSIGLDGINNVAIQQPSGKIIVTGNFEELNGTAIGGNIARLNLDGSLDASFIQGVGFSWYTDRVNFQSDGKMIVAGSFSSYNGATVYNLARLNADGALDNSFSVRNIKRSQGYLVELANGKFLTTLNVSESGIDRLNADGSHDDTFNPNTGFNNTILQTASLPNGQFYASGFQMGKYNGVATGAVAKLNTDGSLDPTFNYDSNQLGSGILVHISYHTSLTTQPDGKLLVGTITIVPSNTNESVKLFRLNTDGTLDNTFVVEGEFATSLTAGMVGKVIVQDNGKIIISGTTNITGTNRDFKLVRLNSNGSLDASFPEITTNGSISDMILLPDGKILVAGGFSSLNGNPVNKLARLLPNGTIDNTFYTDLDLHSVTDIDTLNNEIYVSGEFDNGSAAFVGAIRKVSSTGVMNPTFDVILTGNGATVPSANILVESNGKMILAGEFDQVNGVSQKNLAKLNADGSLVSNFDVGTSTDGRIYNAFLQPDNTIIIAGDFVSYDGTGRNRIAKITNTSVLVTNTTPINQQTGLCQGNPTTLTATGLGTLYWYDSPTSTTPIQTGASFTTPSITQDSTYFYVLDSIASCGASDRLEILVKASPSLEAVSKPNYIFYLDANGQAELQASELDSASTGGCTGAIASLLFDDTGLATRTFDCGDTTGVHNLVLRVTDSNGNTDTSPSIVKIKDAIAPTLTTQSINIAFDASNTATISALDFVTSLNDNCSDSANINVVFSDTRTQTRVLNCASDSINYFDLHTTDLAGNTVITPVFVAVTAVTHDFNVNVVAQNFRPNQVSYISVYVNNNSCATKSGQVKLTLPASTQYDPTYTIDVIPPDNIVGNDLFWNITDLNFAQNFVGRVVLRANNSINIGDNVCFTTSATPTLNDYNLANNTKNHCFPVVNSYDPNDKQVYPQGICDEKFTQRSDLPLTYTIRFQNTGNAPALNVNIVDSLSNLLDIHSLRVIGSSHAMEVDTLANNTLNFRFDDINLPDSSSNPALSQGYVIFELSEIAAHTDTSRIENRSFIYFDTNAPIITNTVKNTILDVVPLCDPAGGGSNPPIADCQLPTNLRTEILTSTKVKLLWNTPATTNAINYEVLRNGQRLATIPSSNLSFVDSTLTENTHYNYSIKAICGNNTAISNIVQVRTLPSTPVLLSLEPACKGESGIIEVRSAGAVYRVYDSEIATTPLFETNNASIETPVLNDSTTFYISVIISGQESERLEVLVPIKEVFEAVVEQGSLLESCATDFTLSAQEVEGATYTWFRENIQVGTERTLTTTFEARYKVVVIKNGCSDESEFTTTRFVDAPTAKIEQGNSITFCGSGILNAQDTSSNVSYEWTLNGNTLGNGTSISISESGTYTLKASQPSCADSVNIAVTITSAPTNVNLTADKTAICLSEETTLSATTGTGFTYKWFRNNTVISTTSASFSTSEIGTYKVEITTQDGCEVTTSEVEITRLQVNQASIRINTENGKDKTIDIASQDAIDSVKWFKDGVEIIDFANQNLITPTETGNYKAIVIYSTGCSFETEEKIFTVNSITGIEEESAKIFTIYPNPNTGSFKVEFATTTNQKTNLVLIDGLGRTIHSQAISMNEKTTSITLPKISAGVYVVQIVSEGKVYTKQLIIQ
ncbi:hypothetical protein Fleli_3682 [Bernardetia litoralis DSM 6794]|uniref:Fibronectin type-III domain-containing protein n=1 Tax=Bernardetia litoralis (strain ATCC 23117 / DSM 6794 / NBRC 15988 / NCIMB 1366 / Fx l1 / Sio-4) TaxID=880071 RepID=I4APW1_BERLS|nr:T9SS type A sorting domain-containing protein [Bernardetia litoralis]AFM05996.1 hypothetical protein Fleli_3682 [Bernardetia litoralis DSM 6794]